MRRISFCIVPFFLFTLISTNTKSEQISLVSIKNKIDVNEYHDVDPNFLDSNFNGDNFIGDCSFLKNYFYHLVENKSLNTMENCGYTAISMFLSYYDTFWNDNFIPEICESTLSSDITSNSFNSIESLNNVNAYQSPGVDNEFPFGDGHDLSYYRNYVTQEYGYTLGTIDYLLKLDEIISYLVYEQIDNNTFLGKLFDIAISQNILNPYHNRDGSLNMSNLIQGNPLPDFGVNYSKMNTLLEEYLDQNPYLESSVTLVTSQMSTSNLNDSNYLAEKERIRDEIITIIESGRPVIIGGNKWNDTNNNGIKEAGESGGGHVCVAYYYDSFNDAIYGNMGWGNNKTYVDVELSFFDYHIHDYWALNIGASAERGLTNNYYFVDKCAYYSPGTHSLFNKIKCTDFNFPDSYNDTEITSQLIIPNLNSNYNNEIVNIKRLRTGYIHDECVNLSTIRRYPGKAYLDFTFPRDVNRITVNMSWWSNDERVNPNNSLYQILGKYNTYDSYYLVENVWQLGVGTNRANPHQIPIVLDGIKTFRIYGEADNYVNDRNKGRLSIFDIIVEYYDLTV